MSDEFPIVGKTPKGLEIISPCAVHALVQPSCKAARAVAYALMARARWHEFRDPMMALVEGPEQTVVATLRTDFVKQSNAQQVAQAILRQL
jgi:hypothetical protein